MHLWEVEQFLRFNSRPTSFVPLHEIQRAGSDFLAECSHQETTHLTRSVFRRSAAVSEGIGL
jgi:hypothetical protein